MVDLFRVEGVFRELKGIITFRFPSLLRIHIVQARSL
jgi:hypothetical protein